MKHFIDSKKTVLAFVLTLTLLVTMLPVGVFADGHTVTITQPENGTVELVEPGVGTSITEGQTVTLRAIGSGGALLDVLSLIYDDGEVAEPTYVKSEGGAEIYTFTMGATNVEIYAHFVEEDDVDVYRIVVDPTKKGSQVVNVNINDQDGTHKQLVTVGGKGHKDEVVEIKVTPDSDYRLDQIVVEDLDNKGHASFQPTRVSKTTDTYIFLMPEYAVRIKTTFKEGPNQELLDKVNLGTGHIANPDLESYNPANSHDHVVFAGKTWSVLKKVDEWNGTKLLLLSDTLYDTMEAAALNDSYAEARLLAYSGETTYTDVVTDATGDNTSTTYNSSAAGQGLFSLSIEDVRKYFKYEDQLTYGVDGMWFLRSSSNGQKAFIDAYGQVSTGDSTDVKYRPAVYVNVADVTLIKLNEVGEINKEGSAYTLEYKDYEPAGRTWNLLFHDNALDGFDYRSAYRTNNQANVTNDVEIVVTDNSSADAIIGVKDGRVVYFGIASSNTGNTYKYYGFASKFDKYSEAQLYVIKGSTENYASQLYPISIHTHQFAYSEYSYADGKRIEIYCTDNDGHRCIFNQQSAESRSMYLTDPDANGKTSKYNSNAHSVTIVEASTGALFVPNNPTITYYTDAQLQNSTTKDWFYGNGASGAGQAPEEAGTYWANILFDGNGKGNLVKAPYNTQIQFTVGRDVYKVSSAAVYSGSAFIGETSYTFDDAAAVCNNSNARTLTNRPASGTAVTVTVSAGAWNGWIVDGLNVIAVDGTTVASFDAVAFNPTGTAVATYVFTMPATDVLLVPLFREHVHSWSAIWSSDGSVHWHDCLYANCTTGATGKELARDSYGVHEWYNWTNKDTDIHEYECSVCGIILDAEHNYLLNPDVGKSDQYLSDASMHWVKCTDCAATWGAVHVFVLTRDAVSHWYECVTCGYIKEKQDHVYDQKVSDESYCKEYEVCSADGIYYMSCSCGACARDENNPTFTVPAVAHQKGSQLFSNEDEHWYQCNVCSAHLDVISHSWIQVKDDEYLVYDKIDNCEAVQTYYAICSVCRITAAAHTFTASGVHNLVQTYDAIDHWKVCTGCSYKTDHVSHTGIDVAHEGANWKVSIATCTHGTIYYQTCSDCGCRLTTTFSAMDIESHEPLETKDSKYLATAATCTLDAIYYKSCVKCGTTDSGLGTFAAVGTKLGHKYTSYASLERKGHDLVCEVCHQKENEGYSSYYLHNFNTIVTGEAVGPEISFTTTVSFAGPEETTNVAISYTTSVEFSIQDLSLTTKAFTLATTVAVTSGSPVEVTLTCKAIFEYHIATCSSCNYCTGVEEHITDPYEVDYKLRRACCTHTAICDICGTYYGELDPGVHVLSDNPPYNVTGPSIENSTSHQACYSCGHNEDSDWHKHTWVSKTIGKDNIYYDLWMDYAKVITPAGCDGTHAWRHDYCTVCNYGRPDYDKYYASQIGGKNPSDLTPPMEDKRDIRDHDFTASGPAAVLVLGATCTEPAKYWCVCRNCGTSGALYLENDEYTVDVFTSGEALGHDFEYETNADQDNHYYECKKCHIRGSSLHAYSIQEDSSEYLVHDVTCQTGAAYYYHCICGATSSAYYITGSASSEKHNWVTSYDSINHWKECTICHSTKESIGHTITPGANCKETGCCSCGYKDGNAGSHEYKAEYSYNETNHYYECSICGITTSATAHSFIGNYVTNGSAHWYATRCSICGYTTTSGSVNHSGGTATCTKQAVCEICGTSYGDLEEHEYVEGVYQHDDTQHWQVCTKCNTTSASAKTHTFVNCTETSCKISGPTCTLEALYACTCSICGITGAGHTFRSKVAEEDKPIGHHYVLSSYVSSTEAIYKCDHSSCNAEVSVKLQIDGQDVTGEPKNYVYSGSNIKKANVAYSSGWDDSFCNLAKDIQLDYPANTASVGAITVSATSTDGLNLVTTYYIIPANQTPNLQMAGYTYEGTVSTPEIGTLYENPTPVYYYKESNEPETAWKVWESINKKTLTPASYNMKAFIPATHDYNPMTTDAVTFVVTKAAQTLRFKTAVIPYETLGYKLRVDGVRTTITSFVIQDGQPKDVLIVDASTGAIETLRAGTTKIVVTAAEDPYFFGKAEVLDFEITSRALDIKGMKMVATRGAYDDGTIPYFFGELVSYDGIPEAWLRKVEKAVPGYKYEYVGTVHALEEDVPYAKTETTPTLPGIYSLLVSVLDGEGGNKKYVGVQTINFVIEKVTPTLVITAGSIIYMDKLTNSALEGLAYAPAHPVWSSSTGAWYFQESEKVPHVSDSGATTYEVVYSPSGVASTWFTTASATITVVVNKRNVSNGAVIATCGSYTYGGTQLADVKIGKYANTDSWTFGDNSEPTDVTYYYSPTLPNSPRDGEVWNPKIATSIVPGNYFFWAAISSSDYNESYTKPVEFTVYKGTQATPSFSFDANNDKMIVAPADRNRVLEYSVDGTNWISVPKLDGNGGFVIAGLTNGEHTLKLRAAETNLYLVSAATQASVTINNISVAYHANRGVGSIAPVFVKNETTVAAADSTGISRLGYTFREWNTSPDGLGTPYAIGASIASSVALYAIWTPNAYNVVFDANGGSSTMEGQNFTYGSPEAIKACTFTAPAGKKFAGWSTRNTGSALYADKELVQNIVPEGIVTLYAIWADLYSVGGRIYSCTNSSVKLTLMQGSDVITEQAISTLQYTTNALGTWTEVYEFENIPEGLYNIVVEQILDTSEPAVVKIMTEQIYVSSHETKDIVITDSRVKSLLEVKEGTRHVVVGGLAEEAEGKRAENKDVVVKMNVEAVVKEELPPTATDLEREIQRDIVAIDAIAKTPIVEYFNADIFETITRMGTDLSTSSTTSQIRNTHTVMEIVVPYDMTGVNSIQIYRAHNGQAIQLSQYSAKRDYPADGTYWVEMDKGLIHIYATKFSVYAIGINAPEPQYWGGGGGGAAKKPGYVDCPKDETCPIEPYIDAINNEWYHDGVHFCIEEKIMLGRGAINFVPEGNLLRAEIVTMLWRRAGSPKVSYDLKYKDIEFNRYYTDALCWATKLGVVTGYDETHFGPNDNVTREQLSTMLFRYAQIVEDEKQSDNWTTELTFKDTAKISDYATNGVHWCFEKKIVEGKPNNIFDPLGYATRAEAACMVQRFCNR